MNALLVRVGADQSIGGGSWNGPVDTHKKPTKFTPAWKDHTALSNLFY